MKKPIVIIFIMLAVLIAAPSALAVCSGFPDSFYGSLTIDGSPAPAGTEVRALLAGRISDVYTTSVSGQYGSAVGQDKLYVPGASDGSDFGETITFQVKLEGTWVNTGEEAIYECGNVRQVSLSAGSLELPEDADEDGHSILTDCNDNDNTVFPGATELVDGKDNDCDGTTDEGTSAFDDDEDGYSEQEGDCNDADSSINPGENEVCDGVNNDCDAQTQDGLDEPNFGDVTTCGVGACFSTGAISCVGGVLVNSCLPESPSTET